MVAIENQTILPIQTTKTREVYCGLNFKTTCIMYDANIWQMKNNPRQLQLKCKTVLNNQHGTINTRLHPIIVHVYVAYPIFVCIFVLLQPKNNCINFTLWTIYQ